jgi:hypothetical protein
VKGWRTFEVANPQNLRLRYRASAASRTEANPNPWLSSAAEFVIAARAKGRTYTRLIEEIVELAMKR